MGRNKKQISYKSPFKLRRRPLKDGRFSLFIDHISAGTHQYEFLNLYLQPESLEKNRRENLRVLKKAYNIIRSKTEKDLNSKIKLIDKRAMKETLLSDFIESLIMKYYNEGKGGYRHLITARGNLLKFRPGARMKDLDVLFCRDYSAWLRFQCWSSRGGRLAPMTCHVYSRKLRVILEQAVRAGYLNSNPWDKLDRIEKIPEPERMQRFLTRDELSRLETTPYKYPLIKSAFLFACYSGLRISDVLNLKWHEIYYSQNRFYLDIVMKKTLKRLNVPLSTKALECLPYREGESNRVFDGLPGESQIQKHLKKFCERAGVTGRTHFHISRHTFATLLLTAGVDIYTASKMMGHSDIRSTQVYVKVIDQKKIEAINLMDKIVIS